MAYVSLKCYDHRMIYFVLFLLTFFSIIISFNLKAIECPEKFSGGMTSIDDSFYEPKNKDFKFKGYIEGNNIMEGDVNVIVTDGFTGNIAIKAMEGTIGLMVSVLKGSLNDASDEDSVSNGSQFALDIFKEIIDPRRHNGALLVGLNGIVVKSHGSSDSYGHYHAILTAVDEVKKEIIPKMIQTFEK